MTKWWTFNLPEETKEPEAAESREPEAETPESEPAQPEAPEASDAEEPKAEEADQWSFQHPKTLPTQPGVDSVFLRVRPIQKVEKLVFGMTK